MNFKYKTLIFLLSFMVTTSCGKKDSKAADALGFKPLGFTTPISFAHIKQLGIFCVTNDNCFVKVIDDIANFIYSFRFRTFSPSDIIIDDIKFSKEDLVALLVYSLKLTKEDAKKYIDNAEVDLQTNFLNHLIICSRWYFI